MVKIGEKVLLFTEELGLSRTPKGTGDQAIIYGDGKARGESAPSVGDEVLLASPELGQTVASVASGDLALSIRSTNSPIIEGDTLTVTVEVTNNNDSEESGTITLTIDNLVRDDQDVTVPANSTETTTLAWNTADGDAGDYSATVKSGFDSASTSITVQVRNDVPEGDFSVDIYDTNSAVAEGATAIINVNVVNNLGSEQSGNIVLFIDGEYVVNREVENVPGGATYPITLKWPDTENQVGSHTALVESGTKSDTATIDVEAYGGEIYRLTNSVYDEQRGGGENWVYVEDVPDNTRLIELTMSFQQAGEYISGHAGIELAIRTSDPTGETIQHEVNVPEGDGWGMSGIWDEGFESDGALYMSTDDGDGAIGPP
jgi:hypothetical protein